MRLDAAELELLAGPNASALSHAAKLVYILGIRPYMDYATGLVGYKRRVSYQSLRELLEVAPPPGSHREERQYTVEAVRAVLRELEKSGLIRWIRSRERGLFFECLAAHRDSSPKNRNNMGTTSRSTIGNDMKNPSADTGLSPVEPQQEHHHDLAEEQHTSGYPELNTPSTARARDAPPEPRAAGMPGCIPGAAWRLYVDERFRLTGRLMSLGQLTALWQQLAALDAEGYDVGLVLQRCVAYGYATFDRRPELLKKSATPVPPPTQRGSHAPSHEMDNSVAAKVRRRAAERERERADADAGAATVIEGHFRRGA